MAQKMRTFWCLVLLATVFSKAGGNERPILGILTQEIPDEIKAKYPGKSSYLAASYVKAVEGSGARVAPIFINRTDEYYRDLLSSVNGVIFPGGDSNFSLPDGYGAAGRKIYDRVLQLQDSGVSMPILGVCLGSELLLYLASNSSAVEDIRVPCHSVNVALPLHFSPGFDKSRLYKFATQEVIDILKTLPVTTNFHKYCVTRAKLKSFNLDKSWRVMSTNVDTNGLEFISSTENFQRPLAAVQFHPEKNIFEWSSTQVNPHSRKAVLSARLFYDWVVFESRLNNQSFPTPQQELSALIYNFQPVFTGKQDGFNEQIYFF